MALLGLKSISFCSGKHGVGPSLRSSCYRKTVIIIPGSAPEYSRGLLQVPATFTNARTFNAEAQRSNAEHGTVNLPAQQPRPIPNYPSFNSPPHPYGYLHWSPRIRNFNPGASPNITVGAPAVSRMIASLPNQPNMFLNFPTTYQQVTTQDITTNSPPVNMSIQRPMDLY